MISETKLDEIFPISWFQIDEYRSSFKFDRNGNGGSIILLAREDIPAKLISSEKLSIESFCVEINLRGQKWPILFIQFI